MPIRSPFSGSLGGKRKHELVEIAEALNISDPEAKMTELKDKIQAYLDANETKLAKTPQFKGLYGKKRQYVDVSHPSLVPSGWLTRPKEYFGRRVACRRCQGRRDRYGQEVEEVCQQDPRQGP